MQHDPIQDFARHVVETGRDTTPDAAKRAAKTFILDTLGVGISGSNGPMAAQILATAKGMGTGTDAHVWGTGDRLPAATAAMCNAYQTHCQEYDCAHEPAVAHVMTVVLPTALAGAERMGGVSGARLMEAVILGVDVAASIGEAAASGLRFFRPGTVGLLGGIAALGKLMGFDQQRMVHALSIGYGQMCGTMQAHTEGSGLLAVQVGFNARNAVTACDLAAADITGPENILMGPYGYFNLIEDGGDPARLAARLGHDWKVTELSHKPFPTGRAAHGILQGCLGLKHEHGFGADQIAAIRISVPPLVERLVARPPHPDMTINYARLCARYVLASAMLGDGIKRADFTPEAFRQDDRHELAGRISIVIDDRGDPNAMAPFDIEITLNDGRVLTTMIQDVYGSPANPMTHDAHLAKVRQNCADAPRPLSARQTAALIDAVEDIEGIEDVRTLVALCFSP